MSVTDYSQRLHPNGSHCYLVRRKVKGVARSRSFPPTAIGKKQANRLDEQWAREQKANPTIQAPRQAKERATAIAGVSLDIQVCQYASYTRFYPRIVVQVMMPGGERYNRSWACNGKVPMNETWRQICKTVAKVKQIRPMPDGWLDAVPTRKQFLALRRSMIRNGHNIPISILDNVRDD